MRLQPTRSIPDAKQIEALGRWGFGAVAFALVLVFFANVFKNLTAGLKWAVAVVFLVFGLGSGCLALNPNGAASFVATTSRVSSPSRGQGQWVERSIRNGWNWGAGFINDNCQPSNVDGIVLDIIPLPPGSDYQFTVRCREDHVGTKVKYLISMEAPHGTESAADLQRRLQSEKKNSTIRVAPIPYISAVGAGPSYWYVYQAES